MNFPCIIIIVDSVSKPITKFFKKKTQNSSRAKNHKLEDFETFDIGKGKVIVPKNSLWCGNIPMLCASTNYLISDIKIKNNYIFLISEEKNIIKFINRTSYYDMIEVNDNLKIK